MYFTGRWCACGQALFFILMGLKIIFYWFGLMSILIFTNAVLWNNRPTAGEAAVGVQKKALISENERIKII